MLRGLKRRLSWLITYGKLRERPRHRKVAYNAQITGPVIVGDYTYIGGRTEIRAVLSKIIVGRYCSIGRDVKIFSAGQAHRFDGLATYPFYLLDRTVARSNYNVLARDTVIGNDVWIGSNAVIQAGVSIGDGAVVGANSVVTRNVASFTVVAGVPARQLRARYDESISARVNASQWWTLEYPEIVVRYSDFVFNNPSLIDRTGEW